MSKRLRFEWKYTEDFSHKPVSGIYGGLLPSGDLLMEFFLERMAPPDYEIREISPENPAGSPVEFAEQKVVRMVQCGMVANIQSVRSFHEWLGNTLRQIDAATTASPRGEKKTGEGGYL
ncbi:MAG: hypothetical protein ACP5OS_03325 [Leptospirillia bacterium]